MNGTITPNNLFEARLVVCGSKKLFCVGLPTLARLSLHGPGLAKQLRSFLVRVFLLISHNDLWLTESSNTFRTV